MSVPRLPFTRWRCLSCGRDVETATPESVPSCQQCQSPRYAPYEENRPSANLGDEFSTKVDACGDGEDRVLFMVAQHGGCTGMLRRQNGLVAVWIPPTSVSAKDPPMNPMHVGILQAHERRAKLNR